MASNLATMRLLAALRATRVAASADIDAVVSDVYEAVSARGDAPKSGSGRFKGTCRLTGPLDHKVFAKKLASIMKKHNGKRQVGKHQWDSLVADAYFYEFVVNRNVFTFALYEEDRELEFTVDPA